MSKDEIIAEIGLLRQKMSGLVQEANWCLKQIEELETIIQKSLNENSEKEHIPSQSEAENTNNYIEIEPFIPTPSAVDTVIQVVKEEIKKDNIPNPLPEKPKEAKSNLNERLAERKTITPVEQFADSPITDLRKAFTINQKFSYIKNLFDNNADMYNITIDDINEIGTLENALEIIEHRASKKQPEIYDEFLSFIKRRFS
ncbi:MAG: hypothetical protein HYZ42_10585 [Bacteroidetes bacterium]|nr:hypothetical protein [Bacteroidota bacterium]